MLLTKERIADVLGDLIARLARLGEMKQLSTEHSLELNTMHAQERNYTARRNRSSPPLFLSLFAREKAQLLSFQIADVL